MQPVKVPETTPQETLQIVKGLRKHYEAHHGVKLTDEVLADAVYLSGRYVADRFMPDKAIDLIDEASAMVRTEKSKSNPEERAIMKDIKLITIQMEDAVDSEDYERAAKHKQKISVLTKKLEAFRDKSPRKDLVLTSDDLARVIAMQSGIPVSKIMKSEAKQLLELEKRLGQYIIGQSEAVSAVSKAVRRNRVGLANENRPIGSFVFLGPTGVGKTELARVLAREFFGSEKSLVKIDMSEFSERHTVARLVGAPAGYVGYEDSGELTERIRRQPYSLVLFDEIEKAHPDVFHTMLQILEDGKLTDAKGRKIDFSNTIVIMTSNLGADKLQKEASLGFSSAGSKDKQSLAELHEKNTEQVTDELRHFMRPELLNRIDKVVVFHSLSRDDLKKIVDIQINELKERMRKQKLGLTVSTKAKNWLLDNGYDPKNGVRPLRRLIQDTIEDKVAEGMLDESYLSGSVIAVDVEKDALTYKRLAE
jgi:ATP-dependent Clp protease ATP-binding subunit ClpC